jgi:hypothetical protein
VIQGPSTHRKRAALPRLDLSIPSNVEGWAALRRCLYGRNFAPSVELKFQLYVMTTFFIFLASSAVNALGVYYSPDKGSFGTDFVATSFCRIVILSIPIIVQLLLAMVINRYAQYYNLALIAASGRNAALAAALAKKGGHEQRVEELSHADNMLQVSLLFMLYNLTLSLSPLPLPARANTHSPPHPPHTH